MSMTYSLFEFVKENFEDLIKKQPENLEEIVSDRVKNIDINDEDEGMRLLMGYMFISINQCSVLCNMGVFAHVL